MEINRNDQKEQIKQHSGLSLSLRIKQSEKAIEDYARKLETATSPATIKRLQGVLSIEKKHLALLQEVDAETAL